jgi:hypothetical protein
MSSDREDGLAQGASDAQNEKTVEILDACKWRDIARLRSLAETPGGFLDDDLRRAAWPILLGVAAPDANTDGDASGDWKQLPRHRDEEQVQLDVNRAFIYYPTSMTHLLITMCFKLTICRQTRQTPSLTCESLNSPPS